MNSFSSRELLVTIGPWHWDETCPPGSWPDGDQDEPEPSEPEGARALELLRRQLRQALAVG